MRDERGLGRGARMERRRSGWGQEVTAVSQEGWTCKKPCEFEVKDLQGWGVKEFES